jgi:chromosome segregation ATPase
MFAVFAAVAAVGSSMVLGIGFERLRAGFEVVKKQTGFFADAIHKLDQRADELDQKHGEVKEAVSSMSTRVEKVEKQSDFFFSSLTSLESQILEGRPADKREKVKETPKQEEPETPSLNAVEWTGTSEARELLNAKHVQVDEIIIEDEPKTNHGISSMLFDYLRSDNGDNPRNVVYH